MYLPDLFFIGQWLLPLGFVVRLPLSVSNSCEKPEEENNMNNNQEVVQLSLWPEEVLNGLTVPPSDEVDQGESLPIPRGEDTAYIQLSFPDLETD